MTFATDTIAWLILGGLLIFLEVFIPGAILSFLGLSALIIGGLLHFQMISGFLYSMILWFILSIVFILFLRSFVLRFMPSVTEKQETCEEKHAEGSIVEVLERITPHGNGRIRFRDTSWEAHSEETLEKGAFAKIIASKDNGWIVGPIDK